MPFLHHCHALWHVNEWSCGGFLCQILTWSCQYGVVLQPFIDIPVTPIRPCWVPTSTTPHWMSNRRNHHPWLSPWVQSFSKLGQSFQYFGPTGECLGPPPIARRLSDSCGILIPWASNPLFYPRLKTGCMDSVYNNLLPVLTFPCIW